MRNYFLCQPRALCMHKVSGEDQRSSRGTLSLFDKSQRRSSVVPLSVFSTFPIVLNLLQLVPCLPTGILYAWFVISNRHFINLGKKIRSARGWRCDKGNRMPLQELQSAYVH